MVDIVRACIRYYFDMKRKKILFLGIIIACTLLLARARAMPTLEKEFYWYSSEGFNIYSMKYKDFLDELPLDRTLSENEVSRTNLRGWVPHHDGIVYYCNELEILYSVDFPESGAWVYVYFTEIEKWSTYWHMSGRMDPRRDDYYYQDD